VVVGSSSSSNVGRQWLEYVEATVGVCWWSWQSRVVVVVVVMLAGSG